MWRVGTVADNTTKRPQPPAGFEPFEWPKSRDKYGKMREACPNCGAHGSCWSGGGWTHPPAQQAYDEGKEAGIILQGAADPTISCDGTPILCHWSRYSTGRCLECGCRFWHDFGGSDGIYGDWQYYYEPTRGQLNLFGLAGRVSA